MKNAMTASADDERDDRRDRGLARSVNDRPGSLSRLLNELVEAAAEHRRDREQERVAGRGGALVAEERARRVIVPPERETPGISASTCAKPIAMPCR